MKTCIENAFKKFQEETKIVDIYISKDESVHFDGSYEDMMRISKDCNIDLNDIVIYSDENRAGSLFIDVQTVTNKLNKKATELATLKRNQNITKRYCKDALEESGFKRIGCVPNGRNFTEKLNFNENSIDYIVDFYKNFYRI